MKKLLLLFLIPNLAVAEVLSVDLICKGDSVVFCEDAKECGSEKAIEMIKISGNTLVHKIHGNQFLKVDGDNVSMKEMDIDGSIGFSFYVNRRTGEIEIIRGWDNPYHFNGKCEQVEVKYPYNSRN